MRDLILLLAVGFRVPWPDGRPVARSYRPTRTTGLCSSMPNRYGIWIQSVLQRHGSDPSCPKDGFLPAISRHATILQPVLSDKKWLTDVAGCNRRTDDALCAISIRFPWFGCAHSWTPFCRLFPASVVAIHVRVGLDSVTSNSGSKVLDFFF